MPLPESIQTIRDVLRGVRAVAWRRAAARSGAWALFAGMLAFTAASAVVARLGPSTGGLAWWRVAVALAALVALAVLAARFVRGVRTLGQVAALIEARDPALRTDVRTALELTGREPVDRSGTAQAMEAHLGDRIAAELSARASTLGASMPPSRVGLPLGLAMALVTVVAVARHQAPKGFGLAVDRLLGLGSMVDAVLPPEPLVSTLDLLLTPPAYTQDTPTGVPGTVGDVTAIAGTQVDLRGYLLVPASRAVLVLTDEAGTQRIDLQVEDQRLSGTFTALTTGSYTFEVGDEAALRADPIKRRVDVKPDAPPAVTLTQPAQDLEVSPEQTVELDLRATDDFGLTSVEVVWFFKGQEAQARRIPLRKPDSVREYEETHALELLPLGLQPGDDVIVVVEARDNNGVLGPQVGSSRQLVLHVASPEEKNRRVLEAKEALFESVLRQLGGMLAAEMNDYQATPDKRAVVATPRTGTDAQFAQWVNAAAPVHKAWPELLEGWRALLTLMADDPLTTEREVSLLTGALATLSDLERDGTLLYDAAQKPASTGSLDAASFRGIAAFHARHVKAAERAAQLLDSLVAQQKKDALERSLAELADSRERLRDLLEQYSNTRDPALRERIEREMARLEERMRELLSRMADQIEQLPKEHLNLDGLDTSEAQQNVTDMKSALDQLRELLDKGDVDAAMRLLDQMGKDMQSLESELGAPLASADSEELSELDKRMGEIMDELSKVESAQQALEKETNELMEKLRQERQQAMKQEIEQAVAKAKQQLQQLREKMAAADPSQMSDSGRQQMEQMREAMEALQRQLDMPDIGGAAERAEDGQRRFSEARSEFEMQQAMSGKPGQRQQAQRASRIAEEGEETLQQIASRMSSLRDRSEPMAGGSQRDRAEGLAQRQAEAQRALDGLQGQLSQLGERFPMAKEKFGEPMRQAGEGMQQSQDSLGRGRPRPALQGQQQALQSLQQLRQQLGQMTGRQRQQDQARSGSQRERVEVPEQGEQDRAAYRQRVMDAMREGGLQSYDEAIRSYYESLMR